MKKEYDWIANKRNIPNLDLYTKLLGFFYLSIGLNCFLVYIYYKFVVPDEIAGGALLLSITMLLLVLVNMTDNRKVYRDFSYIFSSGIVHGLCSIACIWMTRFVLLYVAYIAELLVILFWIIQNQRRKKRKKRNKRNEFKQQSKKRSKIRTQGAKENE